MVVLSVSPNGSTIVLGGRTPYGAPYLGDALTVNLTTAALAVEVRISTSLNAIVEFRLFSPCPGHAMGSLDQRV